jgi:hypothetical protein
MGIPEKESLSENEITPDGSAALVAVFSMAVFFAFLKAGFIRAADLYSVFTPEHVDLLGMFDSRNQSFAYKAALISASALTVFMMIFRGGTKSVFWGKVSGTLMKNAALIFAFVTVLDALIQKRYKYFAVVALSFILIFLYNKFRDRVPSAAKKTLVAMLAAYAVLTVVTGLFFRPVINNDDLLTESNSHYGIVVSPADRLACGMAAGKDVSFRYGIIMPTLLFMIEKKSGIMDMGGHIQFIRLLQVFFFITAAASVFIWKPKNPVFLVFAIVLLAPWLSTFGKACYIPNQSAFRSIGFPLGILILLAVRNRALLANAVMLGFCSIFLFMLNPETGITISAAYAVFLAFTGGLKNLKQAVFTALCYILGALAGVLFFYLAYCIIFGPVSTADFGGLFFYYISKFSGGYAGLKLRYEAFAAVLFLHSLFIMARGALLSRVKQQGTDEAFKMAVASAVLIWLAYYVNRPDFWNLWTFIYLYIFLIPDLTGIFALKTGLPGIIKNNRAVLAACVLLPLAITANINETANIMGSIRDLGKSGNTTVSGVAVPGTLGTAAAGKIAAVRSGVKPGDNALVYFKYAYMYCLDTGSFNRLPFHDILAESVTGDEFSKDAKLIKDGGFNKIFFDSYSAQPAGHDLYRMRFFTRLKDTLKDVYALKGTDGGIEEWARK